MTHEPGQENVRISRRDILRTVLLGSFVGPQWADADAAIKPHAITEDFSVCHRVRDGVNFNIPKPSRRCDVVVIGGGPSGLIAAYRLRDRDLLMLEKEAVVGGNARADYWRGEPYAAGSHAFYGASPAAPLYEELGLQPVKLDMHRALIVDGELIDDLWGAGLGRLYSKSEEKQVRAARAGLLAVDAQKAKNALDNVLFSSVLQPYGTAAKTCFDRLLRYFATDSETCSGYGGLLFARALMGEGFGPLYPEGRAAGGVFTFVGGLSAAALALAGKIDAAGEGRVVTQATVYRIAQDERGVDVSYMRGREQVTVRANSVIVAAPKFIARYMVKNLPADQEIAMGRMLYAPYLVGTVGFDGVIASQLKAASVVGGPISSFIEVSPAPGRQLFRIEMPVLPQLRHQLLSESYSSSLAEAIGDFFENLFPGARRRIDEIRIWRRGHNWFIPVPAMVTGFQQIAARTFGRIHFANADSAGPISDFGWAMQAADTAVAKVAGVAEQQFSS
ncbi:MAG TPA: FAD-dependent oxidoreductase [Steroidobacteraceae bacterium]